MEWPFNNWLHDKGMLHIKAGFIKWPERVGEHGILFITRFRQTHHPTPDDFIEEEKDLEVRKWLMDLDAEGLQWVSVIDRYGITLDGIQPQFTTTKFRDCSNESKEEFFSRLKDSIAKSTSLRIPDKDKA